MLIFVPKRRIANEKDVQNDAFLILIKSFVIVINQISSSFKYDFKIIIWIDICLFLSSL